MKQLWVLPFRYQLLMYSQPFNSLSVWSHKEEPHEMLSAHFVPRRNFLFYTFNWWSFYPLCFIHTKLKLQPTGFRLASDCKIGVNETMLYQCNPTAFYQSGASLKSVWSQSVANLILVWTRHYGSFRPKLNLQPTGFRLALDSLRTSFRLVKCNWVPLV